MIGSSLNLLGLDSINYSLLNHAISYTNEKVEAAELCKYLALKINNDFEKAEILFYWVSQNIDYDVAKYLAISDEIKEYDILEVRKGICQDYAELYKKLCDLMKIECYVISGFAKGYGYKKGDGFDDTNHAWNIVMINGEYRFVDVTWGSGYLKEVDGKLCYQRKIKLNEVLVNSDYFRSNRLAYSYERIAYKLSIENIFNEEKLIQSIKYYRKAKDLYSKIYEEDEDEKELKEISLNKGIRYSHYRITWRK